MRQSIPTITYTLKTIHTKTGRSKREWPQILHIQAASSQSKQLLLESLRQTKSYYAAVVTENVLFIKVMN